MSIVSDVLSILDMGRGLIATAGLCPYSVWVRTITWSGSAPGRGTQTVVDTPIYVDGDKNPQVKRVQGRDIMPGGTYFTDEFTIGPMTPPFAGGGVASTTLDPSIGSTGQEMFYLLKGPGLPTNGALFEKVSDDYHSPFRYTVNVRRTGKDL